MKKTYILVSALVMAASAGCDKTGNIDVPAEGPETISMTFTADAPPAPCGGGTKVGISGDHKTGYRTWWEDTDAVGVRVCQLNDDGSLNSDGTLKTFYAYSQDKGFTIYKRVDDKATFRGTLEVRTPLVAGEKYAAAVVYPFASSNKIPSSQTMDGASFDRSAAIMISRLQSVEKISKNNPVYYEALEFIHVGTFLNVYVKDVSAASVSGDEIVKTVTITASGKDIAGTIDFFNFGRFGVKDDPAERTDLVKMRKNYTSPTITVNVPDGTELKDLSAMAVAAPFSLEDEYLTVAIETDKHSLQKTLKLTRDFGPGRMTAIGFKVDKSFDAEPYIKVRQTDLELSYLGEQRTFDIDANVPWSVDTESLPEGLKVEKVGETLNVTPPVSTHFGDRKYPVKLVGKNGVTSTVEFIQPSIWEVNGACEVRSDGSVLVGKASSGLEPQLKLKEKVTYYSFTYNISDSKGFTGSPMVSVKTEAGNGRYLVEFRFGGGTDGDRYLVGSSYTGKAAKSLAAADFNKLYQIKTSLGINQAGNSKIPHIDLQWSANDGELLYSNNTDHNANVYWPSDTQGDLTFTLKNRGGGSFVISSYKINSLNGKNM